MSAARTMTLANSTGHAETPDGPANALRLTPRSAPRASRSPGTLLPLWCAATRVFRSPPQRWPHPNQRRLSTPKIRIRILPKWSILRLPKPCFLGSITGVLRAHVSVPRTSIANLAPTVTSSLYVPQVPECSRTQACGLPCDASPRAMISIKADSRRNRPVCQNPPTQTFPPLRPAT